MAEQPTVEKSKLLRTASSYLARPFVWLESILKRLNAWLERLALLTTLERLSYLSVLTAVVFYFAGAGDRERERHYQAWQVINAAQGKHAAAGRKEALQDLVEGGVWLDGVDLSNAVLIRLRMPHAMARQANLRNAYLEGADLRGAWLTGADLRGAFLQGSDLRETILAGANLEGAILRRADLRGVWLYYGGSLIGMPRPYEKVLVETSPARSTDLTGADLRGVDLSGTSLSDVNLRKADLRYARLSGARNWEGGIKDLTLANIYGVIDPPEGFVDWALGRMNAVSLKSDEEWQARKDK